MKPQLQPQLQQSEPRPGGSAARALLGLGGAGLAVMLVLPAAAAGHGPDGSAGPTIRVIRLSGRRAIAVLGLEPKVTARVGAAGLAPEDWRRILAVRVATGAAREAPPMLGAYSVSGGALVFTPRFDLKPGLRYEATFDASQLPGATEGSTDRFTVEIQLPGGEPPAPETRIEAIHPSGDELPENLLRFYIQFSAPMRQGESYRFVHIVAIGGDEVELPFLELAEELWDPRGQRLTLLLDPGRIKRGLVPHEEVGLALRAGTRYALVVDRTWRDARGAPLVEGLRKEFLALAPDRSSPIPAEWQVGAPEAGTREPLVLRFPGPLDHALLHRLVWVEDESGEPVRGAVETRDHETRWLFVPERQWRDGSHSVRVDPALEDLAGNSVGRPFEVLSGGAQAEDSADAPVGLQFSARRP
jgi:hypothetical protein